MAEPQRSLSPDALRARYRAALGEHLGERGERTLHAAYEVGRDAVAGQLGVLDLVAIHHDVLLEELRGPAARAGAEHATRAAGEFLLEALSAFEMVQRGFREAQEAARIEHRQLALLRRLSGFLADASLALDGGDALAEVLWLVAEGVLELVPCAGCRVRVTLEPGPGTLEAIAAASAPAAEAAAGDEPHGDVLVVPLTTLGRRPIGSIRLHERRGGAFTELDEAVLTHVAQMASAAVERAWLYGR